LEHFLTRKHRFSKKKVFAGFWSVFLSQTGLRGGKSRPGGNKISPGGAAAPLLPAPMEHKQGCGLARKGHGNAAYWLANTTSIMLQHSQRVSISLFTWSKQKWLFWRAGFYPANQNNLKSFQNALIDWKKPALQKKPFLFWSCKQAICGLTLQLGSATLARKYVWPKTYFPLISTLTLFSNTNFAKP